MRSQTKTRLLLISSFLVLVAMSTGLIYFGLSKYSHDDFYRLLKLRAVTAARGQAEGAAPSDAPPPFEGEGDYFDHLPDEEDFFISVHPGKDYRPYAEKIGVPAAFIEEILRTGESRHHKGEIFFKGIKHSSERGTFLVVVKAENYYDSHHFAYLRRIMVIAALIAVLLGLFISTYLSSSIFKPLRQITAKVNQVSSESLHLRLDYSHVNDELGELINTFNNMLDRIETSFETQNNFISNASHEFRTPLTAIIGEAEVALSKKRTADEHAESIRIILQEAEKLDKKTKALLFLAQTGLTGKTPSGENVRVDELLWDVIQTLKNINPKSDIVLDLSGLPENPAMLTVNGNTQLLHLAFSNIVNNASKYSDNAKVNVSISAESGMVSVTVKDLGIGIPEGELRYIYDPFFRASNTETYEGYGIGMPLSRNIIRMHNGEIIVSSQQDKGTTVQVNLPAAETEGRAHIKVPERQ